jgi:hypothetical protein
MLIYKSMHEHKNTHQGEFLPPLIVDGPITEGPARENLDGGYFPVDNNASAACSGQAEIDGPSEQVKENTHEALYKIAVLDDLWRRRSLLKNITIGFIRDRSNSREHQSYLTDYADNETEIWHNMLTAQTLIARAIGIESIPLRQSTTSRSEWKIRITDRDESDYFKSEFNRVFKENRETCRGTSPRVLKKDIEEGRAKVVYPVPYRSETETAKQTATESNQTKEQVTIPEFTPEERLESIHYEQDALTAIGVYHQRLGNGHVDFKLKMGLLPMKEVREQRMPTRKPNEPALNYLKRCSPIQVRKAIIEWYGKSTGIAKLRESGAFKSEDLNNAAVTLLDNFLSTYTYEPAQIDRIKNYNNRRLILDRLSSARDRRKKVLKTQEASIIQKRTGQFILDIAGATKVA